MSMDKWCYEQLMQNEQVRFALWFEISSEMESHKDWYTLDAQSQEIIRRILRYVMVEGYND